MADMSSIAVFAYMGYAQVATPTCGKQNDIICYAGSKRKRSGSSKRKQSGSSNSYQRTAKASCVDKQTGIYTRSITKEVISAGETFKERTTGRVGVKNDYTTTKTCRVGNKSGYSEYQVQERYRRVDYDGNNSSKGNSRNNSIKARSSSNGKNNFKASSSARGSKASSSTKGIKASASIKTGNRTKGGKVSSSMKASAFIKTSYSTKGTYY